jgi:two-component system LytT family response regulator
MPDNILLPGDGYIRTDTVVHCHGNGDTCTVYLNNGNVQLINESIESIEQKLPGHQFVQLGPSHIVNIDFVNRYVEGPPAHVIMHNGTRIFIPVEWKKRLDKLLNSWSGR